MVVRWIPLIGLKQQWQWLCRRWWGEISTAATRILPSRLVRALSEWQGLVLFLADGYVVEDADWQTTTDGKHYRARVPHSAGGTQMDWVDVPDEAVITEPNRAGRTMVWPRYGDGMSRSAALCSAA